MVISIYASQTPTSWKWAQRKQPTPLQRPLAVLWRQNNWCGQRRWERGISKWLDELLKSMGLTIWVCENENQKHGRKAKENQRQLSDHQTEANSTKENTTSWFLGCKMEGNCEKRMRDFFRTDLEIIAAANIVFTNCHLLSLQQDRKDSCSVWFVRIKDKEC